MDATRTRLLPLAAAFAAALTGADSARAQIPDGHAVIGTSTQPGGSYLPGTPGLFVVPTTGGPAVPITGLPPVLTTDGLGAYGQGAQSVSIRSADGAVIVGTGSGWLSPSMGQVELIVLQLDVTATAVVGTQRIVLGAAGANNNGAAWNVVLPNGEILVFAADGNGAPLAGPMAGSGLARVNTTTGIITPLPTPSAGPAVPADVGGLAVDPTGQFLYYGLSTYPFTGGSTSTLYRHDLTAGTTCPTPIATWPGETAYGVQCDDDDTVYVSSTDPVTAKHFMHTVRPNGCGKATVTSVTSATSTGLFAWGFDLDRASGQFVAASAPLAQNALFLINDTGIATPLAAAPPTGWGTLASHGVAVNNAIESYGKRSDAANHYWFENFPNPGDQPTATGGNPGFSLTMKAAPGVPQASALWLSTGRSSINLLGIEILLAPPIITFPMPAGLPSVTIPMPIPNSPALSGLAFTAQSIHLDQGGLAASRGLQVTLQ